MDAATTQESVREHGAPVREEERMRLEWSPQLAVGVELIDEQHRELFKRMNDLRIAMTSGRAREEIPKLLDFLTDYVVAHFRAEERIMSRSGYPSYIEHRDLHNAFSTEFFELRQEIDVRGYSPSLVIRFNQKLSDWLVEHIMKVDKNLGGFLQTKRVDAE